jgi:hypothetical protein
MLGEAVATSISFGKVMCILVLSKGLLVIVDKYIEKLLHSCRVQGLTIYRAIYRQMLPAILNKS